MLLEKPWCKQQHQKGKDINGDRDMILTISAQWVFEIWKILKCNFHSLKLHFSDIVLLNIVCTKFYRNLNNNCVHNFVFYSGPKSTWFGACETWPKARSTWGSKVYRLSIYKCHCHWVNCKSGNFHVTLIFAHFWASAKLKTRESVYFVCRSM